MPFEQEEPTKNTVSSFVKRHEEEERLILHAENERLNEGDAKSEEELKQTAVIEGLTAEKPKESHGCPKGL